MAETIKSRATLDATRAPVDVGAALGLVVGTKYVLQCVNTSCEFTLSNAAPADDAEWLFWKANAERVWTPDAGEKIWARSLGTPINPAIKATPE